MVTGHTPIPLNADVLSHLGFLACIGVFTFAAPAGLRGQDSGGHSSASIADHEESLGSSSPSGDEPGSLQEARRQRRGYRLGQHSSTAPESRDNLYIIQKGDTLWSISGQHLGDPWQWPALWSYNPEIADPDRIYPDHRVHLSDRAPREDRASERAATSAEARVRPGSTRVVVLPDNALKPGMVFLRDHGYLDREALNAIGTIIGAPEEHMVLSAGDYAYVQFDAKPRRGVHAGQEYAVFRELQSWERYPGEEGHLVRIMGTVTIQSYDRDQRIARVIISEALDVVERGFAVAPVERRFDLVAPKPNEAQVRARIIAATRPRGLIGYGEVVFLDVGRESGVQAGNRFFVVRRGDRFLEGIQGRESEVGALMQPPAYRPRSMPLEVIGELRVIKVRKHTTIALVTRSDTDLTYGDVAEMRVGF